LVVDCSNTGNLTSDIRAVTMLVFSKERKCCTVFVPELHALPTFPPSGDEGQLSTGVTCKGWKQLVVSSGWEALWVMHVIPNRNFCTWRRVSNCKVKPCFIPSAQEYNRADFSSLVSLFVELNTSVIPLTHLGTSKNLVNES